MSSSLKVDKSNMIDKTLQFLRDQLNEYLPRKSGVSTMGTVSLKQLVQQDGSLALDPDSISIILANVTEEYALNQPGSYVRGADNKISMSNPPIHLNLLVVIVANFGDYETALKFISWIILFYQNNKHFSTETHPNFDLSGISQLSIQLQPVTLEQQNHLWGTLGAKFMPSIQYKVSMLTLNEDQPKELPIVTTIESNITKL